MLERSGDIAGALVYRDATTVSVFQLAADDDEAAAALLCAAADGRDLHVTNAPADGRVSRVLAEGGAKPIAGQHEMRLDLSS